MDLSQIFQDALFFQKPEGVLVGTLALLLLALALRGFERFAGPFIGSTARLVRRPLMLGLATALYVGFGLNQIANAIPALTPIDVDRVTTCLVLLSIWRSLTVAGLRFLHSTLFDRWIAKELEDQRDRAMMIALLDRLFNIGLALLRSRPIVNRVIWGSVCWSGLLLLGLQPAVERLSDKPWTSLFWQSHFWMGMVLSGLLLSSTAAQPLIGHHPFVRRLHVATNLVVALLLAMQAISGTRNLLITGWA